MVSSSELVTKDPDEVQVWNSGRPGRPGTSGTSTVGFWVPASTKAAKTEGVPGVDEFFLYKLEAIVMTLAYFGSTEVAM